MNPKNRSSLCAAAIAVLKDKEPGAFIVRDSHSFRGAYGLAMKVATPPPSVLQQSKKGEEADHTECLIQAVLWIYMFYSLQTFQKCDLMLFNFYFASVYELCPRSCSC